MLLDNTADYAAGALMSLRHGGTDVLYRHRADEVLAVCAQMPPRMLLGWALQTRQDKQKGAQAQALVHGLIALFPVLLAAALLRKITDSRDFALYAFIGTMLAVMVRAYWNEIRAPGKVWERVEWLDFETRTWRARKSYPDGSLPAQTACVPLDELALVCFVQQWEQGNSHDVGLCKRNTLKPAEMDSPPCLNQVHSSDDEAAAHEFARALAALWGIECWQHIGGFHPVNRRLS